MQLLLIGNTKQFQLHRCHCVTATGWYTGMLSVVAPTLAALCQPKQSAEGHEEQRCRSVTYQGFGFTNDVGVTAANEHLRLPARHPNWCACGQVTRETTFSFSSACASPLHPTQLHIEPSMLDNQQSTQVCRCREFRLKLTEKYGRRAHKEPRAMKG